MVRTRCTFSKELKLSILRELDAGVSLVQVAREHEIHPETIRQWKKRERKYGERAFTGNGNAYTDDAKITELERTIGQQAHEMDYKKGQRAAQGSGEQERREALMRLIRNERDGGSPMTLAQMGRTLNVSRVAFYRRLQPRIERDMDVRAAMHDIALEHPWYGYRPMTHALRRCGFPVNAKRVSALDAIG